jgi:HMG (high mobility group) box
VQDSRLVVREEMIAQNLKHTLFLSEASKKWNAMSAEAKQKYHEMAQKHKDTYLKA